MRRYTIAFLELRLGMRYPTPIAGADGFASFTAADDDAALRHVETHFSRELARCAKAELSSLAIVADMQSDDGMRFVDDSHGNPHFQDMQITFDPATQRLEVDFESTRTALLADLSELRRPNPVYRKM